MMAFEFVYAASRLVVVHSAQRALINAEGVASRLLLVLDPLTRAFNGRNLSRRRRFSAQNRMEGKCNHRHPLALVRLTSYFSSSDWEVSFKVGICGQTRSPTAN